MRGVVAIVAVLSLAACASPGRRDDRSGAHPGYPPADQATLIRNLQPMVEPYGLEVTRASLIDLDADYSPSPTGGHLALYARPTGVYPTERYIGNLAPLAATLTDVFDRWPKLESFDVCQEPDDDPSDAPPPVTLVNVPRADASAVAAAGSDLSALVSLARERNAGADPRGLVVEVRGTAANHPLYLEALANADLTD
jgi:hypothetical protein